MRSASPAGRAVENGAVGCGKLLAGASGVGTVVGCGAALTGAGAEPATGWLIGIDVGAGAAAG